MCHSHVFIVLCSPIYLHLYPTWGLGSPPLANRKHTLKIMSTLFLQHSRALFFFHWGICSGLLVSFGFYFCCLTLIIVILAATISWFIIMYWSVTEVEEGQCPVLFNFNSRWCFLLPWPGELPLHSVLCVLLWEECVFLSFQAVRQPVPGRR